MEDRTLHGIHQQPVVIYLPSKTPSTPFPYIAGALVVYMLIALAAALSIHVLEKYHGWAYTPTICQQYTTAAYVAHDWGRDDLAIELTNEIAGRELTNTCGGESDQ